MPLIQQEYIIVLVSKTIPKFSSQYGIHLCCRKIVVMVDDLGDEVLVSESGGRFYIVVDSLVVWLNFGRWYLSWTPPRNFFFLFFSLGLWGPWVGYELRWPTGRAGLGPSKEAHLFSCLAVPCQPGTCTRARARVHSCRAVLCRA